MVSGLYNIEEFRAWRGNTGSCSGLGARCLDVKPAVAMLGLCQGRPVSSLEAYADI